LISGAVNATSTGVMTAVYAKRHMVITSQYRINGV
jgi:hypothetical protein